MESIPCTCHSASLPRGSLIQTGKQSTLRNHFYPTCFRGWPRLCLWSHHDICSAWRPGYQLTFVVRSAITYIQINSKQERLQVVVVNARIPIFHCFYNHSVQQIHSTHAQSIGEIASQKMQILRAPLWTQSNFIKLVIYEKHTTHTHVYQYMHVHTHTQVGT